MEMLHGMCGNVCGCKTLRSANQNASAVQRNVASADDDRIGMIENGTKLSQPRLTIIPTHKVACGHYPFQVDP
jgi:hypothetical protein